MTLSLTVIYKHDPLPKVLNLPLKLSYSNCAADLTIIIFNQISINRSIQHFNTEVNKYRLCLVIVTFINKDFLS